MRSFRRFEEHCLLRVQEELSPLREEAEVEAEEFLQEEARERWKRYQEHWVVVGSREKDLHRQVLR